MISEAEFAKMKDDVILVNASRGGTVDEKALFDALESGKVRAAGIDVFEKEPVDPYNPLLKMDNVIVMPHSASYSDAAFKRLRQRVGQEAARILSGKWPENVVNNTCKPKFDLSRQ